MEGLQGLNTLTSIEISGDLEMCKYLHLLNNEHLNRIRLINANRAINMKTMNYIFPLVGDIAPAEIPDN